MKTSATKNCLSADVLVTYATESLSSQEKRMVEEHLVDCPMCSDALEGLSKIKNKENIQKTIQHINRSIADKAGSPDSFPVTGWKTKIAAAALLVALIGGAWYYLNKDNTSENSLNTNPEITTDPSLQNDEVVSENKNETEQKITDTSSNSDKTTHNENDLNNLSGKNNNANDKQLTASASMKKKTKEKNEETKNSLTVSTAESSSTENKIPADGDKKTTELPVIILENAVAEFPGGDTKMFEFIQRNLQYPPTAKKAGLQGQVYVSFVINKDGSIGEIKIVKGISKELDEEAKRVVSAMPVWKPAIKKSEKVSSTYNLVVTFSL